MELHSCYLHNNKENKEEALSVINDGKMKKIENVENGGGTCAGATVCFRDTF